MKSYKQMDKTIEDINWEDVKNIKFYYSPLNIDYIEIIYKTFDSIQLSMENCIPVKLPPCEDVLVTLPKGVKQLSDLPSEDMDKIKKVYKNEKNLKLYSMNEQMYILHPHIEGYIENDGRLDRWEKFKKDVKEEWEFLKPKTIQELKEQLIFKTKEIEKIQNRILNLM